MNKIDLFGSQIQFRFKGQQTFKTPQGAFFTLIIASVIGIRFFMLVYEVYQRKDPFVIYKERQVDSPAKFVINNSTTQIAFGMQQSSQFLHYIDPQVYTVQVRQITKSLKFNKETNKDEPYYTTTYLDAAACTSESFQNPKTKNYFLNLDYTNLLCVNPKQEMYIEGDYSQDAYSYIAISVSRCKTNCKPDTEITSLLQKAFFAIYYSDVLIDPQQKDEPFQFFTRDNFWLTSTSAPRDLSFEYRNTYISSNYGWFFEDIQTKYFAQQSKTELTYLPTDFDKYFFQMVIRFEKQQENVYLRKYKTVMSLISEIGGFTQTLLAVGFVIFSYFSELQLSKQIMNDAFNFESDEFNSDLSRRVTKQLSQNTNTALNNQNPPILIPQLQSQSQPIKKQDLDKTNLLNQQQQQEQNSINYSTYQQQNSPDSNIQLRQYLSNQQQLLPQVPLPKEADKQPITFTNKFALQGINKLNQGLTFNETKELNSAGKRKTRPSHDKSKAKIILSSIIQKKQNESILFKEGFKVDSNNNNNINSTSNKQIVTDSTLSKSKQPQIKKQIEMDENLFKKMLNRATNSFTLSIMEYIKFFFWPFGEIKKKKRIIDYSINKLYYHLDVLQVIKKLLEVDKLKRMIFDQDQLQLFEYLPKPIIRMDEIFKSKAEQYNPYQEYEILYQDKRTEIQKSQDAYKAFINIQGRNTGNPLDQKLLDNLDPNVLQLFTYNVEQEEKKLIQSKTIHLNSTQQQNRKESQFQNTSEQKVELRMISKDREESIGTINIINQMKDISAQDSQMTEIEIPSEDLQQNDQSIKMQQFSKGVYSKQ